MNFSYLEIDFPNTKLRVRSSSPDMLDIRLNELEEAGHTIHTILPHIFTDERKNRVKTIYEIVYREMEDEEES